MQSYFGERSEPQRSPAEPEAEQGEAKMGYAAMGRSIARLRKRKPSMGLSFL
jgi:hypothetical protein